VSTSPSRNKPKAFIGQKFDWVPIKAKAKIFSENLEDDPGLLSIAGENDLLRAL